MDEKRQDSEEQRSEKQSISQMPERESDSAADALVYDNLPLDASYYELQDVEDSPVGGHQEQVLKEED